MNFLNAKKIHFIAIGGIGVSALAKLAHHYNIALSGSDLVQSDITDELAQKYDCNITIGSDVNNITSDTDLVVHSPAVPDTDPEITAARKLEIKTMSYPAVLGELSQTKKTIAIAGTNGKTTTTSMLVESLKHLQVDPTVIIGGILQKYNSNFVAGDSPYFITEACEYKRSFLNIHHDIAVITNISPDHLDYFDDLADIQSAFIEFIDNKKGSGTLICNTEQDTIQPILKHAQKNNIKIIDYSKYLDNKYQVSIPGEHNRQNMATTLAIIESMGLDIESAASYLKNDYTGAKRRMERVGITKHGAYLYDDYAHNPEGIEYLINGLRTSYPDKKIIMIFEPHLYSRTEDFKSEFGRTLALADELYLFPVYKAREPAQPEKDFMLVDHINMPTENFHIVKNPNMFKELFEEKKYNKNHVVITVGAGDIWQHGLSIKID